jgi:hypothetical protein
MKTILIASITLFAFTGCPAYAQLPGVPSDITVSGTVTIDGQPGGDVSVGLRDGAQARTDASGRYSIKISKGYSGALSASSPGVTFTPSARELSNVASSVTGLDFAGKRSPTTPQMVTVSGRVLGTSGGAPNIAIEFSNGGGVVVTGTEGSYSIQLRFGYTGVATPWGARVVPSSRSYSALQIDRSGEDFVITDVEPPTTRPTISGQVRDNVGRPIANATLVLSPNVVVRADGDGNYSVSVEKGFSGSVTPTVDGMEFIPNSRQYSNVTASIQAQDYVGTAISRTVRVSGSVRTVGGTPIGGAAVSASNGAISSSTPAGTYSLTLPFGFSGTVQATHAAFTFRQPRSFSNLQSDTDGQDFVGTAQTTTFRVSGVVRSSSGSPQAGVIVRGSNLNQSAVTVENGSYSLDVPSGYNGQLTPERSGTRFEPPSRSLTSVSEDLASVDFTIVTTPPPLSITGPSCPLPKATVGVAYSVTFLLSGAEGTPDWNVSTVASLPEGLYMNRATGELGGIPQNSGQFDFVVKASTSGGQSAQKSCSLAVEVPPETDSAACPRRTPASVPNTDARLERIVMSTIRTESPCIYPDARSSFMTTDPMAYTSFTVTGLWTGDTVKVEWYSPGDRLYRAVEFATLQENGDFCFRSPLPIAKSDVTRLPGMWRVRVVVNDSSFGTLQFAVSEVKSASSAITVQSFQSSENVSPESCSVPQSRAVYIGAEAIQQAWILFDLTGKAGRIRFDYTTPDGKLFKSFQGDTFDTGGQCMWSTLKLSEVPKDRLYGGWVVMASFNDVRLATTHFSVSPAQLGDLVISRTAPVRGAGNIAPTSNKGFTFRDEAAYAWFELVDVRAGGRASVEWFDPQDRLVARDRWEAIDSDGTWFFWTDFPILKAPTTRAAGIWTARLFWDGQPVGSTTFVVGPIEVTSFAVTNRTSGCQAPPFLDFLTTEDRQAVAWLRVSGASSGDRMRVTWVGPDKAVRKSSETKISAQSDAFAFDVLPVGDAMLSGSWNAQVLWNGVPLMSVPFTINQGNSAVRPFSSDIRVSSVDHVVRVGVDLSSAAKCRECTSSFRREVVGDDTVIDELFEAVRAKSGDRNLLRPASRVAPAAAKEQ